MLEMVVICGLPFTRTMSVHLVITYFSELWTIGATHMSSLLLVAVSVVACVSTMGTLSVKGPPLVHAVLVATDHLCAFWGYIELLAAVLA